jgi:hypothetical protein
MGRYSDQYIDRLLARGDYDAMVELSGILFSSPDRDSRQPEYRLPSPVFVYVETLGWFAQASRSGVWTYYEATPAGRQEAMRQALAAWAPLGYAQRYAFGMHHWTDERQMEELDRWIRSNEALCNEWLLDHIRRHRGELSPLYS